MMFIILAIRPLFNKNSRFLSEEIYELATITVLLASFSAMSASKQAAARASAAAEAEPLSSDVMDKFVALLRSGSYAVSARVTTQMRVYCSRTKPLTTKLQAPNTRRKCEEACSVT